MLALLGLAAAALVPLPIRPAAHLSQTRHVHVRRAGRLCCEATAPPEPAATEPEADDATERDEAITRFTNEQGVNLLIGRKIEKPSDWLEARMEYAKYEEAELGGADVTFDQSDWIKLVLVVIGGAYIGFNS